MKEGTTIVFSKNKDDTVPTIYSQEEDDAIIKNLMKQCTYRRRKQIPGR